MKKTGDTPSSTLKNGLSDDNIRVCAQHRINMHAS